MQLLLDIINVKNIRKLRKLKNEALDYYYAHFCHLQNERAKIFNELKNSLNEKCCSFEFNNWHRIVSYQYSTTPLSARGSILSDPGGRFNIGRIHPLKFEPFPALYIAEDSETAFREKFQIKSTQKTNGLTSNELSLNKRESITDLLVNGNISTVLDLSRPSNLTNFLKLIKTIQLTKELKNKAKKLKLPIIKPIKTMQELQNTLFNDNWRTFPMQVDVPASSQVFGQIARDAKIEAIIYPSKTNSKKKCIAVFPENFENSTSVIKIQGNVPQEVDYAELNSETYIQLSRYDLT